MPDDKEAPVYTAEKILLKRVRKGKVEYFIKWKGWAAKWNTWEPEKHILDKLLIADFNNRNRKRQKSKSSIRESVDRRKSPVKVRPNREVRTRRLRSSTSSDLSTSAVASPTTNDENNGDELSLKEKSESVHVDSYELRSNRTEKPVTTHENSSDSLEKSDQDETETGELEKPVASEGTKLDESLRKYLWQPTKTSTSPTTTITEVTDQSGVTVLIRELGDGSTSKISRQPRFLGYGNGGRGARH